MVLLASTLFMNSGEKMTTATFTGKDQHWANESTVYWFNLDGDDYGTEKTFENESFGIVDCNGQKTVVDVDGGTVLNEYVTAIVLRDCKITDEMIDA
jgi:hypothetical protein